MLVSRSFQCFRDIGDVLSRSFPRFHDFEFWSSVAMDRRQVFYTSRGWRRYVFDDLGRIVEHHARAQASEAKFGHERRRMGEFPRETRPMLCIGKMPALFVFAESPQKRILSMPTMGIGARAFAGGGRPRSAAGR